MTQIASSRVRHHGGARGWGAALILLAGLAVLASGCGSSSGTAIGPEGPTGPPADTAVFVVRNTAGYPVGGATVYLVPASAVDVTPFDGGDVLSGAALDKDEPLEDAIDQNGAGFSQATTDAEGRAELPSVPVDMYFIFVKPGAGDAEHLPGGDLSRLAVNATTFLGYTTDIVVSSMPPAGTLYQGSSVCVGCHSGFATYIQHAHRLGLAVPYQLTALQDDARYPDYTGLWDLFLPSAVPAGGTAVYFSDYDGARGFDKFKTSLTDPSPGETVYVRAWLWRDTGDDRLKVTLENVINPGDPMTPWTLEVDLTYGGTLHRQQTLLAVPGRNGRYPFLQWQSEGDDSRYERTRKVFRDYHLDWYWNAGGNAFQLPPADKAFEGNCAACHFNGFQRYQDGGTGEWLARGIRDANGVIDIDNNGQKDEINIGCETCHGPGTAHINWVMTAPPGRQARYIITPRNLNAAREIMICGRCHDRVTGFGSNPNEEPLDASDRMLMPGARRAEYVADHADRDGPALSDLWVDELHSKSPRQHYADFLKSAMGRNGRVLTTCSDCHEHHGAGPYEHHLKYDPSDPTSKLCFNCHLVTDLAGHTMTATGQDHTIITITCVNCHMDQQAQAGAGRYGRTTAPPTGTPADAFTTWWENDVTGHLFDVPRKTNPGVLGVVPGTAMPVPYTNSCGFCHNPGALYPKPGVPAKVLPEAPAED